MATAKKKPSGPSGKHQQRATPLRESRPGQIEEWKEAAAADGRSLVNWIRFTLDNAVEQWRRKKK